MKPLIAAIAAVILAGLVMVALPLIAPHHDGEPSHWLPPSGYVVVPVPHPTTTKPYVRL